MLKPTLDFSAVETDTTKKIYNRILEDHPNHKLVQFAKSAGIRPYFLQIDDVDGAYIRVNGRTCINLGLNDYLGLRRHEAVKSAAKAAIDRFGTSLASSRLMAGNIGLHEELQCGLADWFQRPSALLFTTGYQANLGILSALLAGGGECLVDSGVHASAIDGAKLAGARVRAFRHNTRESITRLLEDDTDGPKVVVVDSVYSMDGGVCPLSAIADAVKKHPKAILIVDEAHAAGVLGPGGSGLAAGLPQPGCFDFITGTLSKAFGSLGGFVVGECDAIEALKIQSRPLMFSTASTPASLAAALAALQIIRSDPEGRRERVLSLSSRLRSGLQDIGANTWRSTTHIVPVVLKRAEVAGMAAQAMLDAGIYCGLSVWPAVPKGMSLIRFSVNADLSEEHIDRAVDAVAKHVRPLWVS
jgi:8-amino-7-oxononanoate synthase